MPYVLVAVLAAVVLVLALAACAGRGSSSGAPGSSPPAAGPAPAPAAPAASPAAPAGNAAAREALRGRLRRLAESPPPGELNMGAMCYKTAGPPDRVDYVCPRCGERTVYAREGTASEGVRAASWEMSELVGRRLEECRRQVLGIRDHGVSLDETEFCGKCRPDVREPRLALVVRLPGEEGERRTAGVSPADVAVVAEFLEGKDRHDAGRDREEPLQKYAKRIAELLGLE